MSESLSGTCRVLYCMSIGRRLDLELAARTLTTSARTSFHKKTRLFEAAGVPSPVRASWDVSLRAAVGGYATRDAPELALYEIGALCATWSIDFRGSAEDLVALSVALYANEELEARSRALAGEVVELLGAAVDRPEVAGYIEDYVVFQLPDLGGDPLGGLDRSRSALARALRAESGELSEQEIENALAHPVSYGVHDLALVDWLACLLIGPDTEDERLVLEFATVELLELRILDAQLEPGTAEAYAELTRDRGPLWALTVRRRKLEHIARIQADDAMLHEGIDNALKVFGDDYLARLYRTAAKRFHFDDWDTAIQRKLDVLKSIYESLSDVASHRRSEILEWIIILLIALEIVLYLIPVR